jgi:hypothetical protein
MTIIVCRLEYFLPILKKEYVAERVVKAVLIGEDFVVLPRFMYVAYLFKR